MNRFATLRIFTPQPATTVVLAEEDLPKSRIIVVVDLPTDDPEIAGALWNDEGTLKVSEGA